MGTTAVFDWPVPDLLDPADAPAAFAAFGGAIEQTVLQSSGWHSYLPSWTSEGKFQPTNPLTAVGWWRSSHGMCDVIARLTFGPSTNGGSGNLLMGLPITPNAAAGQIIRAKFSHPSGALYVGSAQVGAKEVRLMFPLNSGTSATGYWRNALDAMALGAGCPAVPGAYTVANGGAAMMCGRYRI